MNIRRSWYCTLANRMHGSDVGDVMPADIYRYTVDAVAFEGSVSPAVYAVDDY